MRKLFSLHIYLYFNPCGRDKRGQENTEAAWSGQTDINSLSNSNNGIPKISPEAILFIKKVLRHFGLTLKQ